MEFGFSNVSMDAIAERAEASKRTVYNHFENKEALFAIYHSHPAAPPIPSQTDRELAAYPDALYLIISLEQEPPIVRGYRWRDDDFEEAMLRIE